MKPKSLFVFIVFLITINSCNKDSTIKDIEGYEFFTPGKGLKSVWNGQSPINGFQAFNVGHLSLSADGYINVLYTLGNDLGRKKINVQSGTAEDGAIPNTTISPASFVEEDGNFTLIPNTNFLAYIGLSSLYGEAPWMPINNAEIYLPPKIYENSQFVSSYYLDFNDNIYASYYSNGTSLEDNKIISGPNFCHSADLTTGGTPLIFTAGYNSLQVHDFSTNTLLASIPINIYSAYSSFAPQYTIMKTRRSLDGTKIIGMIQENFHNPVFTAFIYDIANKSLEIKFDAISRVGSYLTSALDFDEEGNIYYPTASDINYEIRKISPTGDNVFLEGFLKTGYIKKLRCAGSKLIVALSLDGNNLYSDDRGKAKLVIATGDI